MRFDTALTRSDLNPFSLSSSAILLPLVSASSIETMELGHWQRDDSSYGDSEDSGDGIPDGDCAGCSRIVRDEEEKRRVWGEGGGGGHGSGEDGLDPKGKLKISFGTLFLLKIWLNIDGNLHERYEDVRQDQGRFLDGEGRDIYARR